MEEQLKQLDTTKALLIGLFIAGFYYLTLYDSGERLEGQIKNKKNRITQLRGEIATMEKTLVDAEKHREISRKLGEEMDAVLRAVPEKYNSLELMKVLSDEAKVVGTSIVNLAPANNFGRGSQEDLDNPFKPVTVTVTLDGTFNQIMLFMSNLTKVSKIILIKDLSLTLKEPNKVFETASPAINYKATFQAYRYDANAGGG